MITRATFRLVVYDFLENRPVLRVPSRAAEMNPLGIFKCRTKQKEIRKSLFQISPKGIDQVSR